MITPSKAKTLTDFQLACELSDLRDVVDCQEEMARAGYTPEKLGQYWDELHAVVGEIARRRGGTAR